jgi:hypothetical protein
MEIWKDVVGYEGKYKVSSLGRIKSSPKPKRTTEKILKPLPNKVGYLMVDLGDGVKIKRFLTHRLVAEAFIPNPCNKEQVNHIDGVKGNNVLSNLEWVTRSENQKHSIRTGLKTAKGIKNSQCVLNEEKVLEIRNLLLKGELLQREIGLLYGVSNITISDIKRGRSWSHI